jgi:mannose-6-phosphate isomerase-like protein (cupin superfamily)
MRTVKIGSRLAISLPRPNAAAFLCFHFSLRGSNRLMQETILHSAPETEFFTDEQCHITELSNTANDEDLSIARARVEPGVTTRWHRLKGTAERYIILSGQGRVEIGTMIPADVRPGDVILIPPDCRQRITNTGTGDLVFLALCTPRFRPENYEEA